MTVDLVVDMKQCKRKSNNKLYTACGWSPYDGYEVAGVPMLSVILGNVVL